jgi:hypothetical protein
MRTIVRRSKDPGRHVKRGAPTRAEGEQQVAPSAGGIAAIRLGLVPMAIACALCILFVPSGAKLAAGLLLARLRLERIRIECERDVALGRIKGGVDIEIARLRSSRPGE